MGNSLQKERDIFESAIRALEAEVANIGAHLTVDSAARQAYGNQIRAMSAELRMMASTGKITWAQAAQKAQNKQDTHSKK